MSLYLILIFENQDYVLFHATVIIWADAKKFKSKNLFGYDESQL
jgi:hypothetical protein